MKFNYVIASKSAAKLKIRQGLLLENKQINNINYNKRVK
jgi:hypothetical protein